MSLEMSSYILENYSCLLSGERCESNEDENESLIWSELGLILLVIQLLLSTNIYTNGGLKLGIYLVRPDKTQRL